MSSAAFLTPGATHPEQKELFHQSVAIGAVERQLLLDSSTELQAQVKDVQQRHDELLESSNDKLLVASGTIADLREELRQKDEALAAAQATEKRLEADLEKAKGPDSALAQQMAALQYEAATLRRQMAEKDAELASLHQFSEAKAALQRQTENLQIALLETNNRHAEREGRLKAEIVEASSRWSREFERRLEQERCLIRSQVVANLDRHTRSTFLDLDRLQTEVRYYQKANQDKMVLHQKMYAEQQRLRRENGIFLEMQQVLIQKQEFYKRLLIKLRDFVFKNLRHADALGGPGAKSMAGSAGSLHQEARILAQAAMAAGIAGDEGEMDDPKGLWTPERRDSQDGGKGPAAVIGDHGSDQGSDAGGDQGTAKMSELIRLLRQMPLAPGEDPAAASRPASLAAGETRGFPQTTEMEQGPSGSRSWSPASLPITGAERLPPLKRPRTANAGRPASPGPAAEALASLAATAARRRRSPTDKRRRSPEEQPAYTHGAIYAPERPPTFAEQKRVIQRCRSLR